MGMKMKLLLASVLIAVLGTLTIGCESQKGTTENKTETKTSQTRDGKTTSETTTTVDTKTTTTPVTPDGGGTTVKKITETTTETTK
jgi:ABC-type glycerol-3-phosphate transport system substrate-binding protein